MAKQIEGIGGKVLLIENFELFRSDIFFANLMPYTFVNAFLLPT